MNGLELARLLESLPEEELNALSVVVQRGDGAFLELSGVRRICDVGDEGEVNRLVLRLPASTRNGKREEIGAAKIAHDERKPRTKLEKMRDVADGALAE